MPCHVSESMKFPQILVIDLGSQYSQVIVRTIRELGVRSALLSPIQAKKSLELYKPKGIIWSGGSASVYEKNSPQPPTEYLGKIPTLGICYGMQYMAQYFGGKITKSKTLKEYGPRKAKFKKSLLFNGVSDSTVWCSHGDSVENIPAEFRIIASSDSCLILAIESINSLLWGVQFHPEVTHTDQGKKILENFIFQICKCEKDWKPANLIENIRQEIYQKLPSYENVIIGFSGGVDSTTLTAILKPALRHRLITVTLDMGNLRFNEIHEIRANAKAAGEINLIVIDASEKVLRLLSTTTDPEKKRELFKKVYIETLERIAHEYKAKYLIQGSLAPDFIESGATGESSLIKSHHNIGLKTSLIQIHPFRSLFKYEVKELARKLNLPKSIVERHPFPGPGLFVRIKGAPVTRESLDILRSAEAVVREILTESGEFEQISQLVVALYCTGDVGVKGDGRKQGYMISVKGVITRDFMTARCIQLKDKTRELITSVLPSRFPEITNVVYNETPKPPATIEPE